MLALEKQRTTSNRTYPNEDHYVNQQGNETDDALLFLWSLRWASRQLASHSQRPTPPRLPRTPRSLRPPIHPANPGNPSSARPGPPPVAAAAARRRATCTTVHGHPTCLPSLKLSDLFTFGPACSAAVGDFSAGRVQADKRRQRRILPKVYSAPARFFIVARSAQAFELLMFVESANNGSPTS